MRINAVASALLGLGLAAAVPTAASEHFSSYSGSAVGYKDAQPLYDELHLLRSVDGALVQRVVLYQCPGGAAFARKIMQVDAQPLRPDFELRDARIGYVEGFRRDGEQAEVYFQRGPQRPMQRESFTMPARLVVDAGFDTFVRESWEELMSGSKVRFDFLVPSRVDHLSFRVQRLRAEREGGEDAQVFRLSLSGALSWFVDGIDVWYADADRRLLRFDGLSNVRDERGENYTARIRFPRAAISDEVPAAVFEEALAVELVESCTS